MVLTIEDYRNINRHVQFHREALEQRQLKVSTSDDMSDFVEVRGGFPGYIHPAFHPDRSYLPPGTAFWVSCSNAQGQPVAIAATRKFENERLLDLFASRQIWFTKGTLIDDMEPLLVDWPEYAEKVAGRLAVHGSLVVDERYGRQGIGTHLIRLVRAASLFRWRQDWNFGLVTEKLEERAFQKRRYGYPFTCKAFEEKPSWGPRHDAEYLNLIRQTEMLAEYSSDPTNLGL